MASIENLESVEQFKQQLAQMDDATLLAQELVQKGALHALEHIIEIGAREESVQEMHENVIEISHFVSDELQKRAMATVSLNSEESDA